MKKEFYKITYQDIDIALEFFDYNEKRFSEFILATIKYYKNENHEFKDKLVEKYFKSYKKTMDFVLQAKIKGKEGAEKRIENQQFINETLEGYIKDTLSNPENTLLANNKIEIINNKLEIKKEINKKENIPTFEEFFNFLTEKYIELNLVAENYRYGWKLKFDSWEANNWMDGNGKQIKNWKSKALNTLKYIEPKKEKPTYYEMPL
jgi:hypothetical protein